MNESLAITDLSCIATILSICFEPAAQGESETVFGIADFLATVAIFVAAYSFADARYKFRTAASWIPFRKILFFATTLGGSCMILTSVWFEYRLPIPRAVNSPTIIQLLIATILITILSFWMFFSFVRPVKFSKKNAVPFVREVYRSITDGSEQQLDAAALEIGRSAKEIISEASKWEHRRNFAKGGFDRVRPFSGRVALDLLSLIGDRRFCKCVAQKHPWVAEELFRFASDGEFPVNAMAQFSRNVSTEFFLDETTAIHHEDDGYWSGLIGTIKPVSSVMFGCSDLVNRLASSGGSPLELMWMQSDKWTARSWSTYNRAIILYLDDYLATGHRNGLTTAIRQIFSGYEYACTDLYKLNDATDDDLYYKRIEYVKFSGAAALIKDVISLLNKYKVRANRIPRDGRSWNFGDQILDELAEMALKLIAEAGSINTPDWRGWNIQHNTLWTAVMSDYNDTPAHRLLNARLQRLIWKKFVEMEKMPNYVSARVILVCLNVMGFRLDHSVHKPRATRALKRAIVRWTQRNFLSLYSQYPDVAEACIGGTITFDKDDRRLVKTYRGSLGREPAREFLVLEPARLK